MSIEGKIIEQMVSTERHDKKWPRILDQLYPISNAHFAGLGVIERSPDFDHQLFHTFSAQSTNVDPVIEAKYLSEADPDFDDYDQIIKRPDVKFAIENLNIFHRVGIRLSDEQAYADLIAFQLRPERRENLTQEEVAPVLPYLPHVAQAIAMGRIYDAIRHRYQAVLSMLDRVNIGMVLMRSDGAIVIANTYAQEIIDGSARIKSTKDGYLQATDSLMNVYLQSRLEALHQAANRSDKYIVRLGDDADNSDLVLELSALLDSEGDVDTGFLGVMAIIIDPNRPFLASCDSMNKVFSLTGAETAVANLIANGNNYHEVAEQRGVSRETVKTQVGNLMRKMNVQTRAGIVRKLMTLGIPFNDNPN